MKDIIIYYKDRTVTLMETTDNTGTGSNLRAIEPETEEKMSDLLDVFFEDVTLKEIVFEHSDLHTLFDEFKSHFTFIEAAGGLVRNSKNQLLVIRRFGKPDLPKGKQEKNETDEQAAVREVEEECGIRAPVIVGKAEPSYHIYVINNQRILKKTEWFYMSYNGNDTLIPQIKEGIVAVEWCDTNKINEYRRTTYPSIIKYFS
jgi:8-oxo-dGTP pyrophosphatase MutT (NUDIX family)